MFESGLRGWMVLMVGCFLFKLEVGWSLEVGGGLNQSGVADCKSSKPWVMVLYNCTAKSMCYKENPIED